MHVDIVLPVYCHSAQCVCCSVSTRACGMETVQWMYATRLSLNADTDSLLALKEKKQKTKVECLRLKAWQWHLYPTMLMNLVFVCKCVFLEPHLKCHIIFWQLTCTYSRSLQYSDCRLHVMKRDPSATQHLLCVCVWSHLLPANTWLTYGAAANLRPYLIRGH